jgi:basic amino acid/polyamine antiporter, APA family
VCVCVNVIVCVRIYVCCECTRRYTILPLTLCVALRSCSGHLAHSCVCVCVRVQVMTVLNILIILFVIVVGSTKIDNSNFEPYFPYGWRGIVAGSGTVFFSYIGFDSVTTLAAETQRPERDLPLGVVGTLGISTLLYVAVSTVICGMVKYSRIDVSAPLSIAFQQVGLDWAGSVVAIATVTSLTATTLCSIQGQPRVFFAMAEDGLLFKPFGWVNRRTGVPVFGTIVSGALASLLGFFFSLNALTDMISIGTLLAFSVVCAGVILLRYKSPQVETDEEVGLDGCWMDVGGCWWWWW